MWAEIQINKQFEMALMATAYGGLYINQLWDFNGQYVASMFIIYIRKYCI